MSRIAETFADLKRENRRGFIPFITACDPDLDTTGELILELNRAGASVIELGVPFSDPMADGPVIQRASERALRHRFGLTEILQTVAEVRKQTDVPIVLFSYFNPLLQFGIEKLAREAEARRRRRDSRHRPGPGGSGQVCRDVARARDRYDLSRRADFDG